jgi:hypothetical protein
MNEPREAGQICPFLGLIQDPNTRFSFPDLSHRCFATNPETAITVEHQTGWCFSQKHATCSLFPGAVGEPESGGQVLPLAQGTAPAPEITPGRSLWQLMAGGMAIIFILALGAYLGIIFLQQRLGAERKPIASAPAATPTASVVPKTSTPLPVVVEVEPTSTATPSSTPRIILPTPIPDGRIYTLSPASQDTGWVVSGEDRGNHFGDSFLYAGIFKGETYSGAFQLDLSSIPRGAPIYEAFIQVSGLNDDRLGSDGNWFLRILASAPEVNWRQQNYQEIFNTETLYTLSPILGTEDLARKSLTYSGLARSRYVFWLRKLLTIKNQPSPSGWMGHCPGAIICLPGIPGMGRPAPETG